MNENNKDRCSTPRCRGGVDVILIDRPLCWKCWEKHCKQKCEVQK